MRARASSSACPSDWRGWATVFGGVFWPGPLFFQPTFSAPLWSGRVLPFSFNFLWAVSDLYASPCGVSLRLEPGRLDREAVEAFFSEQGARWGARRDIISRATFGAVQVLEVLNDPPAGTEVEASFDEFNLDVRVRYVGSPLLLPETK